MCLAACMYRMTKKAQAFCGNFLLQATSAQGLEMSDTCMMFGLYMSEGPVCTVVKWLGLSFTVKV